jgi:uncharacterized protein YlxP (DUF503 family)
MNPVDNIATDLFYKIRSRFSGLKLGTSEGTITINPEQARFFDFDYMDGGNPIGHVTVSLAEENSMKVYFSTGITESMEQNQKQKWYGFLKELRQFAKRRLMAFDTRDIAKDNLDKRDFAFLSQYNKPQPQTNQQIVTPVGENIMSESTMYGTKTVSYQKLLDTRLIIKHSHALVDDQQPGARTRNISALFVENQDGERFKYPFIHLAGARAMQRHVANGGLPYDDVGKSIINMSEEIAQLKSFSNYVVRNDLMNSDTNDLVSRSQARLNSLREQIARLSKQKPYETYVESYQTQAPLEIPESVVEQYKDQFTVKSFKENIASVFPILYRLQQENSLGYDDIVAETEIVNDQAEIIEDESEIENELDKFESYILKLGETSSIQSEDEDEKMQAVKDLQELISQHFPAGVDGTNAIESLKGIIEDPELYKSIKEKAKEDPDTCVRPLIKDWLEQNAPDTLEQLDFGDMVDEPGSDQAAAEPTGEEEPQMAAIDKEQQPKKLHIQELAEFIKSFYDRESGTFPKGPEGVCTMVGKKFGERAESVARKFVERMAPQQATENNPELQELARIRDLAGLEKKNLTTFESSSDRYDYDIDQHETEVALVFDRDAAGNPTNVKVMLGKADITPVVDRAWLDETIPEMSRDEQSPSTGYPMDLNIGINYRIYGQDRPATREDPPEYAELEIEDIDVLGNGKSVAININDLGRDAGEKIEQDLWDDARDQAEADRDSYDPPYESQDNTESDDLIRIRELAGVQSEGAPYDDNEDDDDDLNDPDNPKNWGGDINDRIAWDENRKDRKGQKKAAGDDNEKNEAAFYEDDDEIQELRAELRDVYKRIYDSASQGNDETDHISDDLDEFFDRVEELGDADMQQGFEMLRSTIDTSPKEQAEAAQRAITLLDPPEPDVEIDRESVELNDIRRLSGIAQEGDRIRDISPEDDPDDVGSSFYDEDYVFDLASRVFAMNPNLSAKKSGDEVVDAAYEIMVKELGQKQANYILNRDEDFVGDLLNTYSRAQHNSNSKGEDIESNSSELEDIRRLSGIAQGISF